MRLLSRFHRGRHRVETNQLRVSDIKERINREYFGEYDPDGPPWQLTSDGRQLMFTGNITVPKDFDCLHANHAVHYESEDFYSNGMFGVAASNRPIPTDLVDGKITCTDCGKQLFMDPETGTIVCDGRQEWHTNE